jgi:hypothetical protein
LIKIGKRGCDLTSTVSVDAPPGPFIVSRISIDWQEIGTSLKSNNPSLFIRIAKFLSPGLNSAIPAAALPLLKLV